MAVMLLCTIFTSHFMANSFIGKNNKREYAQVELRNDVAKNKRKSS
jgi:hypothetical protein